MNAEEKRARQREAKRRYLAKPAVRERVRESRREWASRPGVRDRLRENNREYARKYREKPGVREKNIADSRRRTLQLASDSGARARRNESQRKYAKTPRARARANEWQRTQRLDPERRESDRQYARAHKHGLTVIDVLKMESAQGNRCAICRCQLVAGKQTHIDHDHGTGAVRGILCHPCNVGGHFKDSPERCEQAASYLRKHKGGTK